MLVSAIVAMDRNGVIGDSVGKSLPWGRKLPRDLRRFRDRTMGKVVIFGRKTFEGLPSLPGRAVVVFTRRPDYRAPGFFADDPKALLDALEGGLSTYDEIIGQRPRTEVIVGGGAETYAAFLPYVQRLYLTMVDASLPGDVWFPEAYHEHFGSWGHNELDGCAVFGDHGLTIQGPDEKNAYGTAFVTLERVKP
jgi:dihydrofolate reductase